jgi:hypothetical protein
MEIVDGWIARIAAGRGFVDIGGIGEWSGNEKVSLALRSGARRAAVADILPFASPYWAAFHERMRSLGIARDAYESVERADVTRAGLPLRLPGFDAVYASGIVYHCPDPMGAVHNLARTAGRWLVVNTVVLPEAMETPAGTLRFRGSTGLFLPGIGEAERDVLRAHYRAKFGWDIDGPAPRPEQAAGSVMPWVLGDGTLSCAPYWWFLTPAAFRGMARAAGLVVREEWCWEEHILFLLCEKA